MHMSSACPRGRSLGRPGEYVGEYRGIDWILCPLGGENSRHCFSSKGRVWGNCKFCKITDGNHRDIMGIYHKKGFIKGEALHLLRTNSVRENFEQSKRDLDEGYPLKLIQENTDFFLVHRQKRCSSQQNKTNNRDFTVCYYLQYLQSGHTQSQKDSHETLGHHSTAT